MTEKKRVSEPKGLRVSGGSTTYLTVCWKKPQETIYRYILSVSPCETDGSDKKWQIEVSSGALSAKVENLEPGSVYIISLVAEKGGERSRRVAVKGATTHSDLWSHRRMDDSEGGFRPRYISTVMMTPTYIIVHWKEPKEKIDRYILSVSPRQKDGPVLRRQIEVSSGELSAVIDELEPFSVYIISLVAVKDGEKSQPVTERAVTTHPDLWDCRILEDWEEPPYLLKDCKKSQTIHGWEEDCRIMEEREMAETIVKDCKKSLTESLRSVTERKMDLLKLEECEGYCRINAHQRRSFHLPRSCGVYYCARPPNLSSPISMAERIVEDCFQSLSEGLKLLNECKRVSEPRNLRVVETTPTSIEVQWDTPLGIIDRYILSVSPSQTDGPALRRQIKMSPGEDSAVIEDLEPGSVYIISLVAEIDGERSHPVTVEAASGGFRPRNLRVVETTPTSIEVQWEKPQVEIDRYILSVSPSQTYGPVLRRQIKVSPGEDSAVIDNLEPGSVYIISLVAEKDGERSRPVTKDAATGGILLDPPYLLPLSLEDSEEENSSGSSSAGCCSNQSLSPPLNFPISNTTLAMTKITKTHSSPFPS